MVRGSIVYPDCPPRVPGAIRVGLVATYAHWKGPKVRFSMQQRARAVPFHQEFRYAFMSWEGPCMILIQAKVTASDLTELIATLGLSGTAALIPFQLALVPVLRSRDIAVHASTQPEPFGRSILEAMACARPVIAAAGGGVHEIVQDQINGLTHVRGDVNSLADALVKLVLAPDLRGKLARAARETVVLRFSRARLGPALLAVYSSLLS